MRWEFKPQNFYGMAEQCFSVFDGTLGLKLRMDTQAPSASWLAPILILGRDPFLDTQDVRDDFAGTSRGFLLLLRRIAAHRLSNWGSAIAGSANASILMSAIGGGADGDVSYLSTAGALFVAPTWPLSHGVMYLARAPSSATPPSIVAAS